MFTVLTTGINLAGRTRWLPLIMGAAAAANFVLNLALIPALGYSARPSRRSWATRLLAIIGGVVSQRAYPVRWELGRVSLVLGLAMALAAAALLGPDHVAWRLATIAAYPAGVVGLGILHAVMAPS